MKLLLLLPFTALLCAGQGNYDAMIVDDDGNRVFIKKNPNRVTERQQSNLMPGPIYPTGPVDPRPGPVLKQMSVISNRLAVIESDREKVWTRAVENQKRIDLQLKAGELSPEEHGQASERGRAILRQWVAVHSPELGQLNLRLAELHKRYPQIKPAKKPVKSGK